MRLFLVFLLLGLFIPSVVMAEGDNLEARLKAARDYERTYPASQMMDEMIAELKKNPAISGNPELIDQIVNSVDEKAITEQVVQAMAKHFSLAELQALSAFYETDEGQSILKKMPAYMADIAPLIQQEVLKGLVAAQMPKGQ